MTSRNTKIARNEERKEVGRRENTVKDLGGPVAYPVLSLIPGSHDHLLLTFWESSMLSCILACPVSFRSIVFLYQPHISPHPLQSLLSDFHSSCSPRVMWLLSLCDHEGHDLWCLVRLSFFPQGSVGHLCIFFWEMSIQTFIHFPIWLFGAWVCWVIYIPYTFWILTPDD